MVGVSLQLLLLKFAFHTPIRRLEWGSCDVMLQKVIYTMTAYKLAYYPLCKNNLIFHIYLRGAL